MVIPFIVISLALDMSCGSVFMILADCSKMFMKRGGKETE